MSEIQKPQPENTEPFDYDAFNNNVSNSIKHAIEQGIDITDADLPALARPDETKSEIYENTARGIAICVANLERAAKDNGGEEAEKLTHYAERTKTIVDRLRKINNPGDPK